ncbi:MAG: AAA family ATPase [Clostridia bacterium]|nr:AAA family ATPase [Clostridia bacterium]
MANSKRRARCLLCGQLVPKEPSTILPYAVKPLTIDGKHGCICSICVDDHYAKHNSNVKALTGFSKRSTLNEIIPLPVDTPFTPPMQSPTELLASALKKLAPIPVVVSHAQTVKTNPKPKEITVKEKFACLDNSLDSYFKIVASKVFGQDEAAQMVLYTIYYNQMANLLEFLTGEDLDRRNHILLIGNTGTGKTFLATTVAKAMKLPYAISNATSITSAGYIGAKVENLLESLYRNAGCNLDLAENGIVILDEVDKKRVTPDGNGRDVTGRAVQEELLKILEPSDVYLKEFDITFNTRNLTVILMGAFVGLDEVIKKRMHKKVIGFRAEEEVAQDIEVTPDDLINYGFIPEFVGRIPAVISLNNLTKDVIIDIIYSLISKLNLFFKTKDVDLIIDDRFIDTLAEDIMKSSTGARDVYKRFFYIFQPALYRIFQSNGGGVCEYDEHGNTTLIVGDKNAKMQTYEFESLLKLSFEEE